MAENVSKPVMGITGHAAFMNATKDRPQAVQQTLKPILERIKADCGDAGGAAEPEPALKKSATTKKEKEEKEAQPQMNSFARAKKKIEEDPPQLVKKSKVEEDTGLTINPTNKKKRE